jgi:site-specific recombinase XerD
MHCPTNAENVKATLRGIRRTIGTAQNRKAPATADIARAMARAIPCHDLMGKRDRALILLGFAGAFRRSELVALDITDIEQVSGGLRIAIRQSKSDQEGAGYILGIPLGEAECPVKAVTDWLEASQLRQGALFRPISPSGEVGANRLGGRSVANIVKKYAALIGLEPKKFAGHSLRSGFLTSAAANGASIFKMMDLSRHKSADALRGYVRDAELFKNHAGIGLL